MPLFRYSKTYMKPTRKVFNWHKNLLALDRITPPWDKIKIIGREFITKNPIKNGIVTLEQTFLPLIKLKWKVLHGDYSEGKSFQDSLISGPLKKWTHKHDFKKLSSSSTTIEDTIQFDHWISLNRLNKFTLDRLHKSFDYRSKIIEHDLENLYDNINNNYILISGATGMIGGDLVPLLNSLGYKIIILKFDKNSENDGYPKNYSSGNKDIITFRWNPYSQNTLIIPKEISNKIKFLVNLSGENILGVWTKSKKDLILKSRISSTRSLYQILKVNSIRLDCSIHASATGFYGSKKSNILDENNSSGLGFLAETTKEWEKEQNKFSKFANRNINLRIGTVLSSKGGLIKLLELPFRLGVAGHIGEGKNYMSWILLEDLIRIIANALQNKRLSGPVNAVSPNPIQSKEFFHALAKKYNSKFFIKIPSFIPKILSKDLVDEIIISDQKIAPKQLLKNNYIFLADDINKALDNIISI